MASYQRTHTVSSRGKGFTNITEALRQIVSESGVRTGLCTVFVQHTSASLVIQENADPAVLRDLERWLNDLAPESRSWEHDDEGPDDMPAHVKASLLGPSLSLPVRDGRLALGTWQSICLVDLNVDNDERGVRFSFLSDG